MYYIVNIGSKRNTRLESPTLLVTVDLLVGWKSKGEENYLGQIPPELGYAVGKSYDNRLKTRTPVVSSKW